MKWAFAFNVLVLILAIAATVGIVVSSWMDGFWLGVFIGAFVCGALTCIQAFLVCTVWSWRSDW
jgi:hypothetical protein